MDSTDVDAARYERLANDVYVYGSVSLALAMATETGMIRCLCTATDPLSSAQMAAQLKLKERYVREALNSLTVAGLVQLEEGTGGKEGKEARYWVPLPCRPALQKASAYTLIISSNAQSYANVRQCFDENGPYCFRYQESAFAVMDELVRTRQETLASALLETPGLKNRLERGLKVMDAGCGTGRLPIYLASVFPNSHFILSDLMPDPLEKARQQAEKEGVTNVSFQLMDVCQIPDNLKETFDLVMCQNVIHDLPYPSKALKEISKVLKPGGHFALIDILTCSYLAENAKNHSVTAALYAESVFKCIPESYQQTDSAALGKCWGIEKATELIEAAGMQVLGRTKDSRFFEKGLRALDAGCGTGRLPLYLASMFPNSHFVLSDLMPDPLEKARQQAEKVGVTNVSFQLMDVCQIPDDLKETFDLVMCRNVIHDLPYPSKAVKEISKVLKPGGHFSMMDIFASTYVAENAKNYKVTAALYSESAFKCIPESYQQLDSAALGNCWGIEKATELVEAAGMQVLGLTRFSTTDIRYSGLCMCQKPE